MPMKHESKRITEELTEPEIYAAIRYLEPKAVDAKEQGEAAAFVMCGIFLILMGCLGFVLFYS